MEKAIVFGAGENYKKYIRNIEDNYEVVAVVDNNYANINDERVKSVSYIHNIEYDKIIITPSEWKEIYEQLITEGVNEDIIVILEEDTNLYYKKILDSKYYGQHCDDLIIKAIFARIGIEKPSYIDLGANHPIIGSNTIAFYINGCRGINIEANPFLNEKIKRVKADDVNINVGISTEEGVLPFYICDEASGLNTFSREEMERWGWVPEKVINLKVTTLEKIIQEYCPDGFPDFLDCDIEGLDYDVLNTIDLKSDGPKVICVEVRKNEIEKFDNMLDKKDYYKFCRIGENNIYVRKEYSKVVSHLEY